MQSQGLLNSSVRLKKVKRLRENNIYLDSFKSISEASRILNISKPSIVNCLSGRAKSAGGYVWKYC